MVPQNIDFKIIESKDIDDDFIEFPILSSERSNGLKDRMALKIEWHKR
jgi:hypothetical protein